MGVVLPFKRPEWRAIAPVWWLPFLYMRQVVLDIDDGIRMETDIEYAARIKRLEL
jgi:hypothetical protein